MIDLDRVQHVLRALPRMRIALVGDLFLDRYLEIDPEIRELSVETGLEAFQVTHVRNCPGALGTVMNNLASLGAGALLPVTVVGDDGQAHDLLQALRALPAEVDYVLREAGRMTPTYTKPLKRDESGLWRELNRLDLRNRAPLAADAESRLLQALDAAWAQADGLIVLDQVNEEGWGVVTPRVRERLRELAQSHPDKLMFVDSRRHIGRFEAGILKPNLAECLAALGEPPTSEVAGPTPGLRAAEALARRTGRTVFCTLGSEGVAVAEHQEQSDVRVAHAAAYPAPGPIDPVGAGDSATAGIVASLLAGARAAEAAEFGNLVASITIQQIGTTGVATPDQVTARWAAAHS